MGLSFKRGRLWIDPPVQSRLLWRLLAYFLIYTATLIHVGFAIEVLQRIVWNGEGTRVADLYVAYLGGQSSLLLAAGLIVPLLLYDLVKFSHRIVGPLYRCRRVMDEMASGKPVGEFVPRTNDLMAKFFLSFNQLINAWNARVGVGDDPQKGVGKVAESVSENALS